MKKLTYILILSLALFSCVKKGGDNANSSAAGDSLQLKHATGFAIYYHKGFKEVVVYNPWEKGSVYARYYLTKDNNTETPPDGTKVLIPLQTIAITSVTHIEFINLCGKLNTITGICSPHLVYNEHLRNNIENKTIADLGDAFSMNVEKAMALRPQALMTSGYNQNDPNMTRVSQAKIPVLYNNEWMETTLPGRAEWIKFVSAFYDKETEANHVFAAVEENYTHVKTLAAKVSSRPRIMSGTNFRGTWYMPGGKSYMGQLFADAGAGYFYSDDAGTGSLPLSLESVIMNFGKTDVWLNCNFNSIEELIKADSKHALFQPVSSGEVYNFNKRALPSGANDFWESAVAHPDLLLSDVIKVLHPTLLPEYELVYTEKLK
ncbi:iron ABC transporter substrate-binding protein [Paludibacter sp. 221]|uniref:ABC transporter substrate-binding protein n=1 Tax=Paludibacter sp. 221 TaxID=2302939 RepID=UPI0013D2655B|nr:ABC transporter substrate-binding protein [Paludibacter sp. 221]NDV47505.1 iron ABC transporter substrate-binding protein [Paludibacter sp. 221]